MIESQSGLAPNTAGTWLQLAFVRRDSSTLIGDCGIHFREDDPRQVELGVTLSAEHQGQGFATEALSCVPEYLFERLDKHRVTAVCDAENHAAARLFQLLGFRQEAYNLENIWFKGSWGSERTFALLKRERRTRVD